MKKPQHKCSVCGTAGHNAKTCSQAGTRAAAPADPQYRGTARVRVLKPGVSGDDLALEKGIPAFRADSRIFGRLTGSG